MNKKNIKVPKSIRRRYRVIYFGSGILTLVTALIAQTTSRFTPFLSNYPAALEIVASAGFYTLIAATLLYIFLFMRLRRTLYAAFVGLMISSLLLIRFTILGEAFQLSLAGLTIGGSLIILGCIQSKFVVHYSFHPKRKIFIHKATV